MTGLLPVLILLPFLAACVVPIAGEERLRVTQGIAIGTAGVELMIALVLALGGSTPSVELDGLMGLGLYLRMDGFGALYAVIAALMWLVALLFSPGYFALSTHRARFYTAALLTLGGTMGVFLSADLLTLFLFFEVMSFASYVLVVQEQSPFALAAGKTYLAIAVMGGLSLLLGIMLLRGAVGTTRLVELAAAVQGYEGSPAMIGAAGVLMLFGFGSKAGMFPLHIWLPTAHPAAPAPASALLSGALTKTGVMGILLVGTRLFAGDGDWGLLVTLLGAAGMVIGAVTALLSVDIKRLLACSSVSQIGFILIGAGLVSSLRDHNALAAAGTLLHMVNHSALKLLLFLAAGAVYMGAHTLDMTELRGCARGNAALTAAFASGALGLGGVPLFNGYVSKTLLHEALLEQVALGNGLASVYQGVEVLFLVSGGLTAAYMAKLFIALCVQRPAAGAKPIELPRLTAALLWCLSALPLLLGIPQLMMRIAALGEGLMRVSAPEHAVHFFAWGNLRGAVISLTIGAAVYLLIVRRMLARQTESGMVYLDRWPKALSLENCVYRPLLRGLLAVSGGAAAAIAALPGLITSAAYRFFTGLKRRVNSWPPRRRRDVRAAYADAVERWQAKRIGLRDIRAKYERRRQAQAAKTGVRAKLMAAYHRVAACFSASGSVIWEGEGDALTSAKLLTREEMPAEEWEAMVHGVQDELQPKTVGGLYTRLVDAAWRLIARLQRFFNIRVMPFGNQKGDTPSARAMRSSMLRSMFASLATSFTIYLVAFVAVLMVILAS